jgi:alkylhydroperoxidase/carboxymuconolactone decarboxylase family protein YurZ
VQVKGALENELRRREKASALTFLLVVERLERAVRASDLLREVMVEYACFAVTDSRRRRR